MTKELLREIMARLRLTNNYLIYKTDENCFLYDFLRNTLKNCYENLDKKDVTENKKIWKTLN